MNCYICEVAITSENETDEHIIINAAGGRLKSKELICRPCNSLFGEGIDSALAQQLNSMANMLMISRHRGEPQPIIGIKESTGEAYSLEVGGKPMAMKPVIKQDKQGGQTKISVRARTQKELKKILTGIARKNPRFNVEEALEHATWGKEYLSEALKFSVVVGGPIVFRAVCKCATNFFIYKGGRREEIAHLIPYLKGETDADVVWMHYQDGLYELAGQESFHLIHLIGDKREQILYAYVDYFNTYRYLTLLSTNYGGEDVVATYGFDLINVKPIERAVNLSYDRETLLAFFSKKDDKPFEKVQRAFQHSINLGLKRQDENHREELIERALQQALSKYPANTPFTEEMIEAAATQVAKEIAPYILARSGQADQR